MYRPWEKTQIYICLMISLYSLLFATGVTLKGGATLPADLVVDASGRHSKLQEWLLEGGFSPPRSVEVDPHMGYTTAIFDLPPKV